MTAPPPPRPVFPGGMSTAPELTPFGGCAHEPCLCPVESGTRFCCPACARGGPEQERCGCAHFGCVRES